MSDVPLQLFAVHYRLHENKHDTYTYQRSAMSIEKDD